MSEGWIHTYMLVIGALIKDLSRSGVGELLDSQATLGSNV